MELCRFFEYRISFIENFVIISFSFTLSFLQNCIIFVLKFSKSILRSYFYVPKEKNGLFFDNNVKNTTSILIF